MPVTLQNVCDTARKSLNDADKVRYPDADLLVYANDGLNEIYSLRPDLFIGQYTTFTGEGGLVLGSTLPIEAKHARELADYLIFRAEFQDSEHVESNRVGLFGGYFEKRLKG
jgi:hypothetical protein